MSYATPLDVAVNVGRDLTAAETAQVAMWIEWAEAIIARRMGSLADLDHDALRMVLTEAVTARLRSPEPVTQVSVQVDDANVSKTYQRSSGMVEILPEWWEALGWTGARGRRAFELDTMPADGGLVPMMDGSFWVPASWA